MNLVYQAGDECGPTLPESKLLTPSAGFPKSRPRQDLKAIGIAKDENTICAQRNR